MEYAKICKICGKEFTTKLKNEITCSPDCSYKNKMLINRKYQEKQREKRRTEKFKDNLSKDVYECEQLNKERKERGERALSYGYYKAYQRQGVIK